MTEKEFRDLVGKDVIVDYLFFNELQKWSMKNFYIDGNGDIKHNRLDLIIENFIANARNPHTNDKSTYG